MIFQLQNFQLYNKSRLVPRETDNVLFPENLSVFRGKAEENIKIGEEKNRPFPSGPFIKCKGCN